VLVPQISKFVGVIRFKIRPIWAAVARAGAEAFYRQGFFNPGKSRG
jgi:hypothetical protein